MAPSASGAAVGVQQQAIQREVQEQNTSRDCFSAVHHQPMVLGTGSGSHTAVPVPSVLKWKVAGPHRDADHDAYPTWVHQPASLVTDPSCTSACGIPAAGFGFNKRGCSQPCSQSPGCSTVPLEPEGRGPATLEGRLSRCSSGEVEGQPAADMEQGGAAWSFRDELYLLSPHYRGQGLLQDDPCPRPQLSGHNVIKGGPFTQQPPGKVLSRALIGPHGEICSEGVVDTLARRLRVQLHRLVRNERTRPEHLMTVWQWDDTPEPDTLLVPNRTVCNPTAHAMMLLKHVDDKDRSSPQLLP